MARNSSPGGIPVLSRGKHRNPRRGACFMEMASVLAGEPWSDEPKCTHPLLAHLARMVNDYTSDAGRSRLAPHVPSVIGVHGGGLSWEVALSAGVAVEVVPDAPEPLQRVLAVGLLRCEEMTTILGPSAVNSVDEIRRAMADVPQATAWARRFVKGVPVTAKQFHTRTAPQLMTCAVRGIAEAGRPDTDDRLYHLLTAAIATARRLESPNPATFDGPIIVAEPRPRERRFAGNLRG
ncbi:hypothetical protein GCM10009798_06490 [Nocardioides panacihumi]|uniref:DUF222 domain-containing protein n=1 Tax=Nocardioides panacihumi TaxID=400774 RepID=A0ABP5BT66_9ACTN